MEKTILRRAERIDSKNPKILKEIQNCYLENIPVDDIAKMVGITKNQVSRLIYKVLKCPKTFGNSKLGRPKNNFIPEISEEQRNRIHQLAIFDYTPREIAEDVDLNIKWVKWQIKNLGLVENEVEIE